MWHQTWWKMNEKDMEGLPLPLLEGGLYPTILLMEWDDFYLQRQVVFVVHDDQSELSRSKCQQIWQAKRGASGGTS